MPYDAMEQERMLFLSELYTRCAGDARQRVPYETLIEALGFEEAVTKRLQCSLQQDGWVELTTIPSMTYVCRPVMTPMHRHCRQQTIGLTPQGARLMEDLLATQHEAPPQPSASPDHTGI
jgi:hypothetical protein